ncbi:MAG: ABC transporter substrate-binding protein [Betaproteobacteria bacterium]|nr:ABC transporter substrate-binding protein [Betaproteobacteria bacterium]
MRALVALLIATWLLPGLAATFRWSSQGDFLTADPHAQNEGINTLLSYHFFERLTARDRNLRLVPALATSWEQVNATTWRFNLRKGVKFHDGTPFTADDVVFSIERAQLPSSNFKTFANAIGKPRRVDDHTVEIATPGPAPILLEYVNTIMIMSRAWALKNGATKPQDFKSAEDTYASRNANGTGPFRFVSWEPEVKTVLKKNPDWWGIAAGRFEGNVDEIVYRPIKSDATRMAALVSGEIDFVLDPPLQDIARLKFNPQVTIVEGPENRVIFLVMEQMRGELKYSNVKGRNPFTDKRVRQALYAAIDVEAIRSQVMRGQSVPTGAMVPARGSSYASLEPRLLPYGPERAKKLLAEAGFPQGFETQLLCPNNRYVNDERICTALAAMLARIGVKASLVLLPRAQFFQKVDQTDFAIHLYGWGGAATDPGLTLGPVLHSFDGKGKGDFNSGKFRDSELDRLIERSDVEMDPAKRSALMEEALQRVRMNAYTIPLHRQMIPWAVRKGVTVFHRPDNYIEMTWVKID